MFFSNTEHLSCIRISRVPKFMQLLSETSPFHLSLSLLHLLLPHPHHPMLVMHECARLTHTACTHAREFKDDAPCIHHAWSLGHPVTFTLTRRQRLRGKKGGREGAERELDRDRDSDIGADMDADIKRGGGRGRGRGRGTNRTNAINTLSTQASLSGVGSSNVSC